MSKITDKQRLDWMQKWETYSDPVYHKWGRWYWYVDGEPSSRGSGSVRYAIDAAMRAEHPRTFKAWKRKALKDPAVKKAYEAERRKA